MSNLAEFQNRVEQAIDKILTGYDDNDRLTQACAYSLKNGGKRVRPCITLMVAEALGKGLPVEESAVAIEFFHTASLIGDDLPCMDDDDFRRNQPSCHKAFGEATALLSTYALIGGGYELLARNTRSIGHSEAISEQDANHRCVLAMEHASQMTGLSGATGGQFLDLESKDLAERRILEVIRRKTESLFEIAFMFGWLFGGGELEKIQTVKEAAHFFGLAFQVADDLDDLDQDAAADHSVNYAALFGADKARQTVSEALESFNSCLVDLGVYSEAFEELGGKLKREEAVI